MGESSKVAAAALPELSSLPISRGSPVYYMSRCPEFVYYCLVCSLSVLETTHLDMKRIHNWFS